jgi:polyphosphate kinase
MFLSSSDFVFLGIFSNNRDEFFRVRVATIRRMAKWPNKAKALLGEDPDVLLEHIQKNRYQATKKIRSDLRIHPA